MKYVRTLLKEFRDTMPKDIYKTIDKGYSMLLDEAYIGEGFYFNHKTKLMSIVEDCHGYDIHWCYGGVLLNEIVPLSSKLIKDYDSPLQIYLCRLTKWDSKFKDFDIPTYMKQIHPMPGLKEFYMTLSNIDYEGFKLLYDSDIHVVEKYGFKDTGKIWPETEKLLREKYALKQQKKANKDEDYDDYKTALEISVYGKNAMVNKDKWCKDPDIVGLRNERVPLAIFQSAYTRLREIKLFIENTDKALYGNTDSIICDKPIKDFKESKEIGEYGKEYDGNDIFFIRRNCYIVFDKNGDIKKQVLGGINRELTIEEICRLYGNEEIPVTVTETIKGVTKTFPIKLKKKFIYEEEE